MTSILDNAADGGQSDPPLFVVWGAGGVGKTSFALKHADHAAVIAYEVGARGISNTKCYPPRGVVQDHEEGLRYLRALAEDDHSFKTVVLDSFAPFESLLIAHVVKQSGKASYEKMGWGKEVPIVAELRSTLSYLERMKYRGIQTVIIAHEKRVTVKDPVQGDYNVFAGSTQIKETWGALFEWADIVGYCASDYLVHEGKQIQRSETRKLHTKLGSGYQAKQRYGYEHASPLPLDWRAFEDALAAGGDTPNAARERIQSYVHELNDAEIADKATKYVADAGDDLHQLREIENALRVKQQEKKS